MNADIRLIVHRTASSLLLAYVNHHDAAYKWAERRKIERHPTTGAMQLVEIRERIEEIEIFKPQDAASPAEAAPKARPSVSLFDNLRKYELMAFGVPEEWVNDVRAATEDTLFDIIAHLPQEAQEALLKLAVGETPEAPAPAPVEADPFAHPDAQRRFRVLTNVEELRRALDYPWDKWAVFLHPAQSALVERAFSGPARISGSAGTGKTIVALHRAVHLARANPQAHVLLTTFSKPLANALRIKLASLVGSEPAIASRITVKPISAVGYDLYAERFGQPQIAATSLIRTLIAKAAKDVGGHKFSAHFLFGEWTDVADAWQLKSWDAYRDVSRLGRKTRIGGKQREILWSIFERVHDGLAERKVVTWAGLFGRVSEHLEAETQRPFDYAVVDEAQDSASPRHGSWAPWPADGRTASFSPATSASGFSSSHFPGRRSASIFEADPTRCASITARRIRSARRQIVCFRLRYRMLTATPKAGGAPSPCSTGRRRRSSSARMSLRRRRLLAHGLPNACAKDASRRRSAYSCARTRNSKGRRPH